MRGVARWSGFAHPGAAADQDQGGGQAQDDAGVDAEFEQGVTQRAGGFVPGQGQSGADGEDLPGGTDNPDDQKGLELKTGVLKVRHDGAQDFHHDHHEQGAVDHGRDVLRERQLGVEKGPTGRMSRVS